VTTIQVRFPNEAPWVLFRLQPEALTGKEYEEVPVNRTWMRVGSRLAQLIRWTRLNRLPCGGCELLQTMLDIADIRWIEGHLNEITEGIVENARELNVHVRRWEVRVGLWAAIRIERARWRMRSVCVRRRGTVLGTTV